MMIARALLLILLTFATFHARAENAVEPKLGDERVLIRTTIGDLVIGFYTDVAPKTSAQILNLFRQNRFDGIDLVRTFPHGFSQFAGVGPVGSAPRLPAEFSQLKHVRGALSLARMDGDVNSGESSFSIMLGNVPNIDGQYTIFGKVVHDTGVLDVLDRLPMQREGQVPAVIRIESSQVFSQAHHEKLKLRRAVMPTLLTESASAPEQSLRWFAAGTILFMVLIAIGLATFSGRLNVRTIQTLCMLIAFAGAFGLFTLVGSMANSFPWLGTVIFFGSIVLFRWMNRFEAVPRAPKQTPTIVHGSSLSPCLLNFQEQPHSHAHVKV